MLSRRPTEKHKWTEERRHFESDGRPPYGVTYRAERRGRDILSRRRFRPVRDPPQPE